MSGSNFLVLFISIVFATTLVNNILYIINFRKFASYLKKNHTQEWQLLVQAFGEFMTMPPKNFPAVFRYLSKKEYQKMNDQELSKIGNRTRTHFIFGIASFLLLIMLILMLIITGSSLS